ncbi:PREDICTED: spermatogenesis-associated protein 9 [Thamnophis sirtalis]|uniref:Spermatogenesis-associated protein 9 n=1 Tax=Thamnophis sirtalis TaxID=35019 RepID=A0A6I9YVU8_9SAUR|nr:PREDICTED: spermatogenesis-associated protein 9 [Thamnophis sirtalis]
MALRPIGWICGEIVRKFAGQAGVIQRAILEVIDEIRDEFPNLLRLTRSNQVNYFSYNKLTIFVLNLKAFLFLFQETNPRVQKSESVITRVFYSAHGAIIMNGLTTLSQSSNSIAKVLQPQLVRKLTELNILSRRLLRTSNTPKQPLYKIKDKKVFFYDIISYPAKAALTSLMCASYAALIFLAVSINKLLAKLKGIIETEDTSRESSSEDVDENGFPKDPEATSPLQQDSSILPIKVSQKSGSIHTLLSAVDQESEQ